MCSFNIAYLHLRSSMLHIFNHEMVQMHGDTSKGWWLHVIPMGMIVIYLSICTPLKVHDTQIQSQDNAINQTPFDIDNLICLEYQNIQHIYKMWCSIYFILITWLAWLVISYPCIRFVPVSLWRTMK